MLPNTKNLIITGKLLKNGRPGCLLSAPPHEVVEFSVTACVTDGWLSSFASAAPQSRFPILASMLTTRYGSELVAFAKFAKILSVSVAFCSSPAVVFFASECGEFCICTR